MNSVNIGQVLRNYTTGGNFTQKEIKRDNIDVTVNSDTLVDIDIDGDVDDVDDVDSDGGGTRHPTY